jgi:hypothetical protein
VDPFLKFCVAACVSRKIRGGCGSIEQTSASCGNKTKAQTNRACTTLMINPAWVCRELRRWTRFIAKVLKNLVNHTAF